MLAPVRERHGRDLAERYSWVDPNRRALQAQRLAQIELASRWLDEKGIVRNDEGEIFSVAAQLSRWLQQAEQWFTVAESERRERGKHDALAEFLSEDEEVVSGG